MRLLMASLCLAGITSLAHADVRNDIVDIRHGRQPNRMAVLGWTAKQAVVVHRTECVIEDDSGIPICTITLTVADRRGKQDHVLFNGRWDGGQCDMEHPKASDTCWNIDAAAAMKMIKDEQAVLDEAGPLSAGTAIPAPYVVGSKRYALVGETDEKHPTENALLVEIANGHKKTVATARHADPAHQRWMADLKIDRFELAPDGTALAAVTSYATRGGDFYSTEHGVNVIAAPKSR